MLLFVLNNNKQQHVSFIIKEVCFFILAKKNFVLFIRISYKSTVLGEKTGMYMFILNDKNTRTKG